MVITNHNEGWCIIVKDIILVGYGGHAKSISDCIERKNEYRIVGYTDLERVESKYRYLGDDGVLRKYYNDGITNAAVCVGYLGKGDLRERLYRTLKMIGFDLPSIIDPSAIVSSSALVGEGTFIGKRVVVNADAIIGKMAIINTGAIVEHECKIGDFTHVAVGAVLCGQVTVGKASLIGANATILQCKEIGDSSIIPAGSVYR